MKGWCIAIGDPSLAGPLLTSRRSSIPTPRLSWVQLSTFATPLRYALAVPILNGRSSAASGVITAYASEPFDGDHRRMLESAATLFAAAVQTPDSKESRKPATVQSARSAVTKCQRRYPVFAIPSALILPRAAADTLGAPEVYLNGRRSPGTSEGKSAGSRSTAQLLVDEIEARIGVATMRGSWVG